MSHTITGLAKNTAYTFKVRAVNNIGSGNGTASDESTATTGTSISDQKALEAFYDATGGNGWLTKTNWKSSKSLDKWHGVTTSPTGRVTGLNLPGNVLTGSIPVEIGKLTELTNLNLGYEKSELPPKFTVGDDPC